MMYKFEIIIYWSDEDQAFIAEAPELPGCIAHGDSNEEALHNINEAIELWLETAKESGREIPHPKGRKLMYA
jgi:predicted RNase H-like HicB family nuclease